MNKMFYQLLLLLLTFLALSKCNEPDESTCSKYLCRNATYKTGDAFYSYFGGVDFQNTWLNTTLLENITAINDKDCVKKCLGTDGCFSMNAGPVQILIDEKGRNVKYVECHLLSDNAYSNATELVNETNWIHVSVQHMECSKLPCKNGGRCIPDYVTETYICECDTKYWGDYCERVKPYALGQTSLPDSYCHPTFTYNGVEYNDCITEEPTPTGSNLPWCGTDPDTTLFGVCSYTKLFPSWRYLLDDDDNIPENTGADGSSLAFPSSAEVYVPDRIGKVLYLDGATIVTVITYSAAMDKFMNVDAAAMGQAISLWVKISHRDRAHQEASSSPRCRIAYQDTTGWSIDYNYNIGKWSFNLRSVTTDAHTFSNETDPYVWTHLLASYNGTLDDGALTVYVNGAYHSSNQTFTHGESVGPPGAFTIFSRNMDTASPPCILWGDDWMYFTSALTEDEAKEIYEQGKLNLVS